jgi:hypothetical protein
LTLLWTLVSGSPASAQISTSIKGIVTDASGSPVPAAAVQTKDPADRDASHRLVRHSRRHHQHLYDIAPGTIRLEAPVVMLG